VLDADRVVMVRAGLRLDMQNSSQERRRNSAPEGWRNRAPPPPNPAEAHRRWRGERSKPVRLGVREHHTRSLCAERPAETEQWCCWLWPGGSSSDRKRSPPIRAFSATPQDGQRPCRTLAEDPGKPSPELRIPGAAAQTRVVSLAEIQQAFC